MTGQARSRSSAALAVDLDATRRRPDAAEALTARLAEQSPTYSGLGTSEAERLRGSILASFETTGLPPEALPFVLEELETGRNPSTVAAAARALRGAADVPAEAPALLVGAIARLRMADDRVSFERLELAPGGPDGVTALVELARTLALLGPCASPVLRDLTALVENEGETFSPAVRGELARAVEALAQPGGVSAGCCADAGAETSRPGATAPPASIARPDIADLALENQNSERLTFSAAFSGHPTALAFFYTRCTNPEKCSATVTRLARLARLVTAEELDANVAGITYDPGFDRPARLRTYGADRGMVFGPRCSLLRSVGPFDRLAEAFALGVGFGPVTVNRHRLDLVVLDASLGVTERFVRRLWHEEAVLDALREARRSARRLTRTRPSSRACS